MAGGVLSAFRLDHGCAHAIGIPSELLFAGDSCHGIPMGLKLAVGAATADVVGTTASFSEHNREPKARRDAYGANTTHQARSKKV